MSNLRKTTIHYLKFAINCFKLSLLVISLEKPIKSIRPSEKIFRLNYIYLTDSFAE